MIKSTDFERARTIFAGILQAQSRGERGSSLSLRWHNLCRAMTMNDAQIAQAIGVNLLTIYRWKKKGIKPHQANLEAIGKLIGTTTNLAENQVIASTEKGYCTWAGLKVRLADASLKRVWIFWPNILSHYESCYSCNELHEIVKHCLHKEGVEVNLVCRKQRFGEAECMEMIYHGEVWLAGPNSCPSNRLTCYRLPKYYDGSFDDYFAEEMRHFLLEDQSLARGNVHTEGFIGLPVEPSLMESLGLDQPSRPYESTLYLKMPSDIARHRVERCHDILTLWHQLHDDELRKQGKPLPKCQVIDIPSRP